MPDDGAGLTDALTKVPQRIASLVELLTTLDQRILAALDSLEQMRTSVSRFDGIGDESERMAADLQARVAALDERLNRDLDEMRDAILAKLGELDLTTFGSRFDRIEAAIMNIERATVNLDRTVEGTVEALPDFVTKRVRSEARKESSTRTDPPPEPNV